jgi:hypothetical protein
MGRERESEERESEIRVSEKREKYFDEKKKVFFFSDSIRDVRECESVCECE